MASTACLAGLLIDALRDLRQQQLETATYRELALVSIEGLAERERRIQSLERVNRALREDVKRAADVRGRVAA